MKTPMEFQIDRLMHELTLKKPSGKVAPPPPKTSETKVVIAGDARAQQRKELAVAIRTLEQKHQKLAALVKQKENEEASDNRKFKAKKERAVKEKDKPKTAAEKARIERENAKLRAKSGGGDSSSKAKGIDKQPSVSELKALATRVTGQIAVAKQKLSAL